MLQERQEGLPDDVLDQTRGALVQRQVEGVVLEVNTRHLCNRGEAEQWAQMPSGKLRARWESGEVSFDCFCFPSETGSRVIHQLTGNMAGSFSGVVTDSCGFR